MYVFMVGDGKPRSAAMVLSMPGTTLGAVMDILNEQTPMRKQETTTSDVEDDQQADEMPSASSSSSLSSENVLFSVDEAAFDTVEATCKYDIYLQKQEDEMNR